MKPLTASLLTAACLVIAACTAPTPKTIATFANVTVSDGSSFTVETSYLDPHHTAARWNYGAVVNSFGIDGEDIWAHNGDTEEEAPPRVADFVRGHQIHAIILHLEELNASSASTWVVETAEDGRPAVLSTELPEGMKIRVELKDWRETDGVDLPFTAIINDGLRTFRYEYEWIRFEYEQGEAALEKFRAK